MERDREISDLRYCLLLRRRETSDDSSGLCFFLTAENGLPVQDEKGSFVLDEEAVTAYVQSLAEEYDGYGRTRQFHSTRGDVITIDGGTYGSKMDRKRRLPTCWSICWIPVYIQARRSHIYLVMREKPSAMGK